jgi:hypothetical protein
MRTADHDSHLRGVAQGEEAAHFWVSPEYPGVFMQLLFANVGADIDVHDHGLPESFADAVDLRYGGTISPDEAQNFLVSREARRIEA